MDGKSPKKSANSSKLFWLSHESYAFEEIDLNMSILRLLLILFLTFYET